MNERLHPLTLGEVLDRTAHIYRSRFLVYAGIAVIPAGAVLIAAGAIGGCLGLVGVTAANSASTANVGVAALVLMVLAGLVAVPACLAVTAFGWAAMSYAATKDFLGQRATVREAYRSAWSRGWQYLWLCLLMALIVIGAPMAVLVAVTFFTAGLGALGAAAGMGTAVSFGVGGAIFLVIVASVAYVVWTMLRICLAFPSSVVEKIGAVSAIKRSATLTVGTKGRIFVMFLLGVALSWAAAIAVSFPVMIAMALIPGASGPKHAQTMSVVLAIAWYLLSYAVQVLIKPVYGIALAVFYFDQRIRTEGFDIEWMMREAGMEQETLATQTVPWLPPATPAALPNDAATDGLAGALDHEPPKAGDLA